MKSDQTKIIAITNFPIPKTARDIKSILGLAGYCRRFIETFSKITQPLTNLLRKNQEFIWTSIQQSSFDI